LQRRKPGEENSESTLTKEKMLLRAVAAAADAKVTWK
jgi:hypothetical protein